MSSSSSVGSRGLRRVNGQPQRTHCDCGDPVGKWTSWRPSNPGRRFIGCPNYKDPNRDCNFFDWVDPKLTNQWYKDLILQLHSEGNAEVEKAVAGVAPILVQGAGGGGVGAWGCLKIFILDFLFGLMFRLL
ncbi:hypothetical protein LXL04_039375 [Taraxacum kok-saghyz]